MPALTAKPLRNQAFAAALPYEVYKPQSGPTVVNPIVNSGVSYANDTRANRGHIITVNITVAPTNPQLQRFYPMHPLFNMSIPYNEDAKNVVRSSVAPLDAAAQKAPSWQEYFDTILGRPAAGNPAANDTAMRKAILDARQGLTKANSFPIGTHDMPPQLAYSLAETNLLLRHLEAYVATMHGGGLEREAIIKLFNGFAGIVAEDGVRPHRHGPGKYNCFPLVVSGEKKCDNYWPFAYYICGKALKRRFLRMNDAVFFLLVREKTAPGTTLHFHMLKEMSFSLPDNCDGVWQIIPVACEPTVAAYTAVLNKYRGGGKGAEPVPMPVGNVVFVHNSPSAGGGPGMVGLDGIDLYKNARIFNAQKTLMQVRIDIIMNGRPMGDCPI